MQRALRPYAIAGTTIVDASRADCWIPLNPLALVPF
jgi:hypothetical protein